MNIIRSTLILGLATILGGLSVLLYFKIRQDYISEESVNKPNIVVIMADDLGSHDISLRGSNQILTPNIDALGYQGVILNRHYTAAMCSPSRAAFMSGKYSIHTGMQHFVILPDEPRSFSLEEKLLPQYLKEAGYRNHLVGKWHLGIAKRSFLPTHRGFDSHVGYLLGYIDYFDYTLARPGFEPGFDFRKNESLYRERTGEYVTDVLTDEAVKVIRNHDPVQGPLYLQLSQIATHASNRANPLRALQEDLATFDHIEDPSRRTYAAMVKALDRSVGEVVAALKEKQMLNNTIIVFFSDNGGPTANEHPTTASNYPLRGQKNSAWEGGIRGQALVWSSQMQKRHYVSEHLTHITDWLPTFAQVAGVTSYKSKNLDGNDIWPTISLDRSSPREEIVHNIDPIDGYTSYYKDGWKYINGTTLNGTVDTWLGNMPYEDSPETSLYPQLVMKSHVWEALNPYAMKTLNPSDLEVMREKTKITCQKKLPSAQDCKPMEAPCLFHVDKDPCEENNLAAMVPERLEAIQMHLRHLEATMKTPANVPGDPKADPKLNGGVWTWWLDRGEL